MTLDNSFGSRSEGTYGCSGEGLFRHILGMREGYLGSKAEEKGPRQCRVQKIGYDYEHKEAFLREERARVRRAVSGTLRRSASVLYFFLLYSDALFKVRKRFLSIIVLVYFYSTPLLHY